MPEEVLSMPGTWRRDDARGATAVEFALVAPLLLVLVLGIIEFGRAYNLQTTLSGAARESVRVMALKSDASLARATAKDYAAVAGVTLTDGQIAISPTGCTADASVTVTITHPLDPVAGMFDAVLGNVDLRGLGQMRCTG
jgi:Flp pilus assembly protein TadG